MIDPTTHRTMSERSTSELRPASTTRMGPGWYVSVGQVRSTPKITIYDSVASRWTQHSQGCKYYVNVWST